MVTVMNIANASQCELLCMVYEELLESIKRYKESSSIDDKNTSLKLIRHLAETLYFDYDIAKDLFNLYLYVQRLILENRELDKAYELIEIIYTGYKHIRDNEENKKAVMRNTESVYVGMTYGKNKLNECTLSSNRGYTV